MSTTLQFTAEKKHSVRYDHEGEDFKMSIYVPKMHPVLANVAPQWPQVLVLELRDESAHS